jgi:class 3 adenylate cyclase/tetratricopeptide (TPR) repeat protein
MPEERKLVTILFADVTGSTALGESLDPEDVRALMGRYYAHARRVIADHGGTLEKFIGDAVMAVFGLPRALGNDAERALAAGLALREAVATDTILTGRLLLRIGAHSGEVVATSDPASGDFLVTGDVVNVAARLQQCASPGELIASERTTTATQAAFLFGQMRSVEVKGKSLPLRVFPVVGARPTRQVQRPALVGRKPDLLQLAVLAARVLEEQRPHLVSMLAPAGTGKTRLLEEFLSRLEPADGFRVATARCPPYGQTLAYWPLRNLLSELLGDEITRPRVTDAFVQGGYTPEDAGRLAELVLATLGVEREGVTDREGIFAAWRLLIEALARQAPRVLVFEDLHWASESLLDLVDYVTHVRTQAPLLLIALSRPELLDRRPSWGGGRQNFTALALQPLTMTQTRELVAQVLAGLPEAIRERVVEGSGGNPFFVLELVRGLTEQGFAEAPTTPQALPDTVYAAVLARLDLLSAREREVAQVAAVIGRAFRPAALRTALDDRGPGEIDAALDGLLARDLIAQAPGGTFTFCHVLIRDVAYGTLTRSERIRLHAKVAAWLESYAAERLDEFTEMIAYHYREAARLARQAAVPLDIPLESARAVHYLERAGELTGHAGAFAEARTYLQSAIELAPEEEHLRLYELMGDLAFYPGYTDVDPFRKAVACWSGTAEQEPLTGARLLRKWLSASLRWAPLYDRIEEDLPARLSEAQHLAERAGDLDEGWRLRLAHIWLLWYPFGTLPSEEADQEREVALAAAAHFEGRADWVSLSEALDAYCTLSWGLGDWDEMLAVARRGLSVPDLPANERGRWVFNMATSYLGQGDYARCIEIVREVLAHLRPGESLLPLAFAVQRAFHALYLTGRWPEIDELMPIFKEIQEQVHQQGVGTVGEVVDLNTLCLFNIALAHEDREAFDAARSVLEAYCAGGDVNLSALLAAYHEDDAHHLEFEPVDGRWIVWILMFLNEHGVAASRTVLARVASSVFGRADSTIRCVEIAEALATSDLARLERAIDEAEAHGLVPHAARMRLVLAQQTGDRTQLNRARPVLERLGDRRSLHRLQEIAEALDERGQQEPGKK